MNTKRSAKLLAVLAIALVATVMLVIAGPLYVPPGMSIIWEYEQVWYPEEMSMMYAACMDDLTMPGVAGGFFNDHWEGEYWHCGCVVEFEAK
jgi:hypothetical protein